MVDARVPEPPPGFSQEEWERAVGAGRAAVVDPPPPRWWSRYVPRPVLAAVRFVVLSARALRQRLR